ncbi:MAG TPA: hypothetical protein DD670_04995 [Planctomycetaceae bacterium]|nr:hypothetical protein [Planctomycetaceae bacterium]
MVSSFSSCCRHHEGHEGHEGGWLRWCFGESILLVAAWLVKWREHAIESPGEERTGLVFRR